MNMISRILVGLVTALFAFMAVRLLFLMEMAVPEFGIIPTSIIGRQTVRADIAGIFLSVAVMAGLACWKRSPAWAYGAMITVACALFGRILGLVMDTPSVGVNEPMVVEVITIAILYWAYRSWKSPAA